MDRDRAIVSKLLAALGRLSSDDLESMAYFFKSPGAARRFASIIENVVWMRSVEQQCKVPGAGGGEEYQVRSGAEGSRATGKGVMRDRFFGMFNDRRVFPGTRDVIEEVNRVFGLHLVYEKWRKRGRHEVIRKAYDMFVQMPEEERQLVLNRIAARFERAGETEGYHELFRILSQK